MRQIVSSEVCLCYFTAFRVLSINFLILQILLCELCIYIMLWKKIHNTEIMVSKMPSVYSCKSNCSELERSMKVTKKRRSIRISDWKINIVQLLFNDPLLLLQEWMKLGNVYFEWLLFRLNLSCVWH